MKEVKMFLLPNCPHCKNARRMMDELFAENPQYAEIPLRIIDETAEADYANTFDYYKVPTFYVGEEKLHEGVPSEEAIAKVFKTAYEAR